LLNIGTILYTLDFKIVLVIFQYQLLAARPLEKLEIPEIPEIPEIRK
jgi:hypothetical protein